AATRTGGYRSGIKEAWRGHPAPSARGHGVSPSGGNWIGKIPAHWSTAPLWTLCKLNPSKSEVGDLPLDTEVSFVPMGAITEEGTVNVEDVREISNVYLGYTYFGEGDVVVAKITPCFENGKRARAIGLRNGIGFGTTELHVLQPSRDIDRDYLFYVI